MGYPVTPYSNDLRVTMTHHQTARIDLLRSFKDLLLLINIPWRL
jgi:hypothetical protein